MGKAPAGNDVVGNKKHPFFKLVAYAGIIPIFIVILLQGILRDGIQTWLPSLMNENFGLSVASSILSNAVLPILGIISVILANALYHKTKNELKTASILFVIAFAATIPFCFGLKLPAIITICLASLISGSMHGVNLVLISLLPQNFSKYGLVATFTGINNSFTYLGASISSVGFAALAENVGWNAIQLSWCVIAGFATSICVLRIKSWTKICSKKL